MKTITLFFVLTIFIGACSSSKKTTATKKVPSVTITQADILKGGTAFENAVIMKVENERTGVQEEYKWLAENYPGYANIKQSQISRGNRHYDIFKIRTKNGQLKEIYFDITSFYGKL
jgi:ABC-type glycerol-3-phosphate transport system substrate-binding protein